MKYLVPFILVPIVVSGCSSLFSNEEPTPTSKLESPPPTTTPTSNDDELQPIQFSNPQTTAPQPTPSQPPQAASQSLSDVEIVWEIPREPVSKYIIYYGSAADHLDKKVVVDTQDLEQLDDAAAGFVYRYDLKDIPANERLFVSISSVTATGESIRSAPIEVK